MNATMKSGVPLQCPRCHAHGWVTHGWVTLSTTTMDAAETLDWRCTNCQHEWPAVQTINHPSAADNDSP
jgi:DNA-directed RNA polymerase subunit M/transcription elongation factor TFIIS